MNDIDVWLGKSSIDLEKWERDDLERLLTRLQNLARQDEVQSIYDIGGDYWETKEHLEKRLSDLKNLTKGLI